MSPNNPGNFVNDLVEMAKAFEALPKALKELDDANSHIEAYAVQVQRLEMKLIERANEIETLQSTIRALEVDRDHTETMFLEADDRTQRALDFIKATFGNAGSLIQALEPVKAVESIPEPIPNVNVPDPIPAWATPEVDHTGDYIPKAELEAPHTTQPSGQSEPLPSSNASADIPTVPVPEVHSTASTSSPASEVAPTHPTTSEPLPEPTSSNGQSSEATDPSPRPGRYSGKLYSEVSGNGQWPSKDEWLSEGGTLDNFFA